MENIQTLTQLLKNSHCEYQIFDLGRRIKRSIHNCSPMLKKVSALTHTQCSVKHI